MLEEIKAQMSINQQIITESSTGFQERVNFFKIKNKNM